MQENDAIYVNSDCLLTECPACLCKSGLNIFRTWYIAQNEMVCLMMECKVSLKVKGRENENAWLFN